MSNNKIGFDYYSCDTNRYQDIKIKKLKKTFRCNGLAVLDYVLNEIYRLKGYYIVWDDSTAFDVADYLELKESLVKEIISYCCSVGLFDKELLTNESVLTSAAIQRRFTNWSKACRRVYSKIDKYKLHEQNFKMCTVCSKMHEESFKMCAVCRKEQGSKEKDINIPYDRDSVFENSILKYFGFSEQINHDKAKLVSEFCKFLTLKNKIEYFKQQFSAYCELKNKTGYKHKLQNYLGDQSEMYVHGAWDEENWKQKLKEDQEKNNQQLPNSIPITKKVKIDHKDRC